MVRCWAHNGDNKQDTQGRQALGEDRLGLEVPLVSQGSNHCTFRAGVRVKQENMWEVLATVCATEKQPSRARQRNRSRQAAGVRGQSSFMRQLCSVLQGVRMCHPLVPFTLITTTRCAHRAPPTLSLMTPPGRGSNCCNGLTITINNNNNNEHNPWSCLSTCCAGHFVVSVLHHYRI